MRFFKYLMLALAVTTLAACTTVSGKGHDAPQPQQSQESGSSETAAPVFSADEARREFLTGHVFEGSWNFMSRSGNTKLTFEEVAGTLVAFVHNVDEDGDEGGTAYTTTVSSNNGVLKFQMTKNNRWKLHITPAKTLEGDQWYDGREIGITLDQVTPRAEMPEPAPVYTVASAEELATTLAKHSPFTGEWRWGTDRSARVRLAFQKNGDTVSVEWNYAYSDKNENAGTTDSGTAPVTLAHVSAGEYRIKFSTSNPWNVTTLTLRQNGLRGVIAGKRGNALLLQLAPDMPLE